MTGETTSVILLTIPLIFLLSAYLLNFGADASLMGMIQNRVDLWNYPIGKVNNKWVSGHDRASDAVGMIEGTTQFLHYMYVDLWGDIPKFFDMFSKRNLNSFWNVQVESANNSFNRFKEGAT